MILYGDIVEEIFECGECGQSISEKEWVNNWGVCDKCFERDCPCNYGGDCPFHGHAR